MPIRIEMPRLNDTMEEGTLQTWHVKVGDKVSAGDTLADIETDKAVQDLQAFDDGTVAAINVEPGSTVDTGTLIAVLAEPGESPEDAVKAAGQGGAAKKPEPKKSEEQEKQAAAPDTEPDATPKPAAAGSGARVRISPLAAKLAEEHGVEPGQITGTGPDGRIIKRDILKAAEAGASKPAAPAPAAPAKTPAQSPAPMSVATTLEAKSIPVPGMRKTIAKRLVESKTTVPHFQVSVAINMDPLMDLRSTLNTQLETQGIKLSVNDFITRAVAIACLQHPVVNSSWMGDTIQQHGTVNVGTAISLPAERGGGLVVAVCRDVQNKGLRQISSEVKELAGAARGRGLSPEQMSDSTITISNLGMPQFGVTQFTAIINPPNAAIIAVGAAIEKPVVRKVDGKKQIVIGTEMTCTLSGDHRVIDGAVAAEYLTTLRNLLENPAGLLV